MTYVFNSTVPYSEGAKKCNMHFYFLDDHSPKVIITELLPLNSLDLPSIMTYSLLNALTGVRLEIQEPHLRDIAATVYGEASTVYSEPEEAEGIARVIRNRAELSSTRLDSTNLFSKVGERGIVSRKHNPQKATLYEEANAIPIEQWWSGTAVRFSLRGTDPLTPRMSALLGTITGLVSSRDVTRGSFFWDGTGNFGKKHPWVLSRWIGGNDPHYKGTEFSGKFVPMFVWCRRPSKSAEI